MIDVWNDNTGRWKSDIQKQAEVIKNLETQLLLARGGMAEMKKEYILSYMREKQLGRWWKHLYAIIDGVRVKQSGIETSDGECYLLFRKILKSGRQATWEYRIPYSQVDNIKWEVSDSSADQQSNT